MTKVFVPSVPTRYDPATDSRISSVDLRPAMVYGELTVLLPEFQSLSNENCPEVLEALRDAIQGVEEGDYLLSIGDPIVIASAISYICDQNGKANVLHWNRNSRSYQVIEVML